MKFNIRILYLYLFSAVGLIVTIIGSVRLIELIINVYVFKGADLYTYSRPYVSEFENPELSIEEAEKVRVKNEEYDQIEAKRNRQRGVSGSVSMILVGFPLYLYHWRQIQKDNKS